MEDALKCQRTWPETINSSAGDGHAAAATAVKRDHLNAHPHSP